MFRQKGIIHSVAGVLLWGVLFAGGHAAAQTDPLPSWNDGPAKRAIVEFVQATTDQASPPVVPPEARIGAATPALAAEQKPNIVFILADNR